MLFTALLKLIIAVLDNILNQFIGLGVSIDLSGFNDALSYLQGFANVFFYIAGFNWFVVLCDIFILDFILTISWDIIKKYVLRTD